MFKIVLLFVALAVFAEGKPFYGRDLAEAAKSGDWGSFQTLFNKETQNAQFPLDGSVESLQKPDDGHVFSQSSSSFSTWSNDNGKVTKHSGGSEVTNNDGKITRREFTS